MTDRLLVGTRKGLFNLTRGSGQSWGIRRTSFIGEPVTMVLQDSRDNTLYAALNLGHFGVKLQRSTDDGVTWSECAVPKYPQRTDADAEREKDWPNPAPWKLVQIWSLEAGGRDEPGVLWAGTIPGGLFRSVDRGESWELIRSLWDRPERRKWFGGGYDHAGIHSILVDPRNSRHVTLAVSCGGAWETQDGGETWTNRSKGMFAEYMPPEHRDDPDVQDPHRVVRCAAAPDSLWIQHHNGVFRSTTDAREWQHVPDVPPSVFGFAVAVHPKDPETAWLVPAVKDECRIPKDGQVVVSRTRDGGKSFEVLRDGLPQENAYHLVYRHGLDVDKSGDMLAIGSTTGGLWISENQGDNWTCFSRDLPPIYVVRFC